MVGQRRVLLHPPDWQYLNVQIPLVSADALAQRHIGINWLLSHRFFCYLSGLSYAVPIHYYIEHKIRNQHSVSTCSPLSEYPPHRLPDEMAYFHSIFVQA